MVRESLRVGRKECGGKEKNIFCTLVSCDWQDRNEFEEFLKYISKFY